MDPFVTWVRENQMLLVAVGSGICLWLVFGGLILGRHWAEVKSSVSGGCERVSLDATDLANKLSGLLSRVSLRFGRMLAHLWSRLTAPLSRAAEANRGFDGSPTFGPAVFAALTLVTAVAANFILLKDIVPDLLSIPPSARTVGFGRWLILVAPAAIVAGEVVGGIMRGGHKDPTRALGLWVFSGCLAFEVFAAVRRGVDYALEPDPYGSWAIHPSLDGLASAFAYVAMAIVFPVVIYNTVKYLEPVIRRFTLGPLVRLIGRIPYLMAALIVTTGLVALAITLGSGVAGFLLAAFASRNVLLPLLVLVLGVILLLPRALVCRPTKRPT